MALLGGAVLAFWHDLAPGTDIDDFNRWHNREHIPERVGVPGFLRGRRYEVAGPGPSYFILYETDGLGVLESTPYLERLDNPSPWTRRALPQFRNSKRTACRTVLSLGGGMGGALATIDLGPGAGREPELRAWLTGAALPAIAERSTVVGAHLCEADVSATQAKTKTREGGLQDRSDVMARWVVLIEGVTAEAAEAIAREMLSAQVLAGHGAAPETERAVYRLAFCLGR